MLANDEQPDDVREKVQLYRGVLPMSTGVPILSMQSVQIAWNLRVDRLYKVGRFLISNAGTAGGAADWAVNDIKISGVSQFVQPGDVSGAVFATDAPNEIDKFVRFPPRQIEMDDVVVMVTYIGLNERGCPFFSSMVGMVDDALGLE